MIDPSLRLRRAIQTSDTLLVRRIIHSHPSILLNPDPSPLGLSNTSLHLACSLGYLPIVRLLLSLGHDAPSTLPDSDSKSSSFVTTSNISLNELGQTPLHLASLGGFSEIVHLLCTACPLSIPRRDKNGRDAIMLASQKGHDTVVQILLTFWPGGPAVALGGPGDVDGNTALHFASSDGHLLVLRTLLAAGADSERRNVWSWTPIAYSASVQAEVYFKGLVAEVERRKQVRREVTEKKIGGAVRLVSVGDGEEM